MEIFKKRKNLYTECMIVILWHLLIAFIFPALSSSATFSELTQDVWFYNIFTINDYATLFFTGIIFAKYNIFATWNFLFDHMTNIEKFIFSSTALCVCAYTRVFISSTSFDILLVPIFLLAAITIINMFSHLGTVFAYIGKHSTNIWLTHSFTAIISVHLRNWYINPKTLSLIIWFFWHYLWSQAYYLIYFGNMSKSVISIFILYYFHGLQINAVPFFPFFI